MQKKRWQRDLLKEARTEALAIVENAKKQGEASREEIITTARSEAARLKESAIREIDTEKERAIAAVRQEVVSLSVLAASKVLEKEVSEEDNRALIEAIGEAIVTIARTRPKLIGGERAFYGWYWRRN